MNITNYIDESINAKLSMIHTSNKARVLKYYEDSQSVDVELVVGRPLSDSTNFSPIRLRKVPVMFMQGEDWVIGGSVKVGDFVMLLHQTFDTEEWDLGGTPNETSVITNRVTNDINNCVAITGVFHSNKITNDPRFKNNNKFHIVKGDNYLTMGDDGVIITSAKDKATIHLDNNGDIEITTNGGKATVKAVETILDSNVTVTGSLTVNNGFSMTGGTATISGNANITGDATISGISYAGHKHTTIALGSDTSTPHA